MAIPFKSNIDVPNNWKLTYDNSMPMLQISNNYITLGNTERSLQLNSYLDVLIRADGTNILESNSSTLYLGSANKMTNINGSSISIGSDGTNVGIGGSNSAVIIQGSTIALNPSKGLYVNGNLGTAGQVLTSNGAALSPTWNNLPKFHFWKYSNNRWIDESYPEINKWTTTSTDRYDIDAELFGITNFEDKSQYQFGFVVAQISATGHFYKGGNVGVAHDITTLRTPIFFTPEMNDTKVGGNIYALNPQDNAPIASTTYNIVGEFEFYIGARTQGSTLVLDAKINFLHGPSTIANFIIDDLTGCSLTGGFIFK